MFLQGPRGERSFRKVLLGRLSGRGGAALELPSREEGGRQAMSGSAVGLVYVLDIPLAAAWRQECGGRVEAGVPLGMGKNSASLYMLFLTAGNALLALAETTVGRRGPLSRANYVSPHLQSRWAHCGGRTGNRSLTLGGRERGNYVLDFKCLSWEITVLHRL